MLQKGSAPVDHAHLLSAIQTIGARLEAGQTRFEGIEGKIDKLASDVAKTKEKVAEMNDVVVAYTTARNVGRFTKWIAPIVGAIVVVFAAVKTGLAYILTEFRL